MGIMLDFEMKCNVKLVIIVIIKYNHNYTGEFGVVYEGLLKRDSANEIVAVKTLKGKK